MLVLEEVGAAVVVIRVIRLSGIFPIQTALKLGGFTQDLALSVDEAVSLEGVEPQV